MRRRRRPRTSRTPSDPCRLGVPLRSAYRLSTVVHKLVEGVFIPMGRCYHLGGGVTIPDGTAIDPED